MLSVKKKFLIGDCRTPIVQNQQNHLARSAALTYMSIRKDWTELVADGQLVKLGFAIPGPPEGRTVLMTSEVAGLIDGPWDDTVMGDRCARLRANLETFLSGSRMTVCWEPFKGKDHHQLGRLNPITDGVWDLRSVDPSPGLRLFFCLAEKDVMIAFLCSPRSIPVSWLRRLPLGPRTSKQWKQAQSECKRQWKYLFPAHTPLVSDNPDDCISKAIVG